jgi:hypothetical protein
LATGNFQFDHPLLPLLMMPLPNAVELVR